MSGLRDDMVVMRSEESRTRTRLHNLEGLAETLVGESRQRRRDEKRREDRVSRRLQVLTVAVAAAALFEPFLYHLATGR